MTRYNGWLRVLLLDRASFGHDPDVQGLYFFVFLLPFLISPPVVSDAMILVFFAFYVVYDIRGEVRGVRCVVLGVLNLAILSEA